MSMKWFWAVATVGAECAKLFKILQELKDYYVNCNYNVRTPGEANIVTDSESFLHISNCIFKVNKFITKIFTSCLFFI